METTKQNYAIIKNMLKQYLKTNLLFYCYKEEF